MVNGPAVTMVAMSEELRRAGKAWHDAKKRERDRAVALYEAIRVAVADGVSESEAARIAGVDRMTVRRAVGKL